MSEHPTKRPPLEIRDASFYQKRLLNQLYGLREANKAEQRFQDKNKMVGATLRPIPRKIYDNISPGDKIRYANMMAGITSTTPRPHIQAQFQDWLDTADAETLNLIESDSQLKSLFSGGPQVESPQAGPSGEKRQKTTDSSDRKRPAETQITGPSPQQPTTAKPTEMPLPGTGNDDNMEVTTQAGTAAPGARGGGRGFSGGFSTATGPEVEVPRPMNFANHGMLHYNKVHRVLAYGLAKANLEFDENNRVVTTSLMEIPWDRLLMYMNPGEIASLPPGCFAKSCSIRIVQRNPRVAFETAASTTALATLNQNKFGIKAVGLNLNRGIRVVNRRYTAFNATEPMIPTTHVEASYTDLNTAMYGVTNSNAAFNATIPASPFMTPMAMPNYLCCLNNSQTLTNVIESGWYSLSEHVTEFDMQATAGTTILEQQYQFGWAPLTPQLQAMAYTTLARNFAFTIGDQDKHTERSVFSNLPNLTTSLTSSNEVNDNLETDAVEFNRTADFETLLEQAPRLKTINTRSGPKHQPSIHIGISPVPKLTTTAGVILSNSWTDVQAYYEIHCHLEVGFAMPHHNTHYSAHNVEMSSIKMGVDSSINTAVPAVFGRYQETYPAP